MVQTGKPIIWGNLNVGGTLVCLPDIWGNRFAPPESEVELVTTHAPSISLMQTSVLGSTRTDPEGEFLIYSLNHPLTIPAGAYVLEITNSVTHQIHKHPIGLAPMTTGRNNSNIKMGKIQVPWTPDVPTIARINGREFKYPADVARALLVEVQFNRFKLPVFGASTHADVLFSVAGQPKPDDALDFLFSVIEAEGPGTTSKKSEKFLSETARALNLMQVRKPLDVVKLGLEKLTNTRFNTRDITDFTSFRLDKAVKTAFGIPSPPFLRLEGRAAFCVVLFAVGYVVQGRKIFVSVSDQGPNHVTSVTV